MDAFAGIIVYGKFILLAFLLILSFINGHKEYIEKNPRKFMWDSFIVGLSSAVAVAAIAQLRGVPEIIPNISFISFFLFFSYNVFRELSGFNAVTDASKLTQGEQKQVDTLQLPIMVIAGISVLALTGLALVKRVPHPQGFSALMIESIIFGGLTGVAEAIVASNHHENPFKSGGANFLLFFVGYIVMQYGGFNNKVFSPPCRPL